MCGRLTLRTPPTRWCQQFLPSIDPQDFGSQQFDIQQFPPRYNVAPTQMLACVMTGVTDQSPEHPTKQSTRQPTAAPVFQGRWLRWGLLPPWAKELSVGNRMINARSETAASKPSFRQAFSRQRCLVLADGYYEWKKMEDGKQPYLIEQKSAPDGVPATFAMAGLWETNTKIPADKSPLYSCTILTTAANNTMSKLHDRMPVILERANYERWLDPTFCDLDTLQSWMAPAPDDSLSFRAVDRHVNNARNQDARCIASA
ncbi:SOS response-associated peptidase [Rubripirellula reticaptiva]|uniref:Abasic site processing protein n=1 Tax=Rubripirellula reticaptiva TaxID=2528013 RepID=A0A5C6F9Q8_9BACT|nr:SOS response-associated peptidase [Rubripirellula reticaptiva]TWU57187.1 putative SOS response-associated peptidase YedK [Rubripirellula reticaptiva]